MMERILVRNVREVLAVAGGMGRVALRWGDWYLGDRTSPSGLIGEKRFSCTAARVRDVIVSCRIWSVSDSSSSSANTGT